VTGKRVLVGVRAYARHRTERGEPTSHVAVVKAIADGRLRGAVTGSGHATRIDLVKADAAWKANTDPAQQRARAADAAPRARRKNDGSKLSLMELRTENLRWTTRREKLAYLQESGKLVPLDQVKKQVFGQFHALQTKSYQMVERVARRLALAADERKVRDILLRELRAIYEVEADRALREAERAELEDERPVAPAPAPATAEEDGDG